MGIAEFLLIPIFFFTFITFTNTIPHKPPICDGQVRVICTMGDDLNSEIRMEQGKVDDSPEIDMQSA